MNPEVKPLADAIYRDRVKLARRTPPEQRLLDGVRLFDEACERMMIGITLARPNATEEEKLALLRQRIRRMWRLSDAGYYRPA